MPVRSSPKSSVTAIGSTRTTWLLSDLPSKFGTDWIFAPDPQCMARSEHTGPTKKRKRSSSLIRDTDFGNEPSGTSICRATVLDERPFIVVNQRDNKQGWKRGVVTSYVELEPADRRFYEAGPCARLGASLVLAIETWRLAHPLGPSPRPPS